MLLLSVGEGGDIPPGNVPGETKWQSRVVRPKADIKLTAGKAINVPIENLIDQVVKTNKVSLGSCVRSERVCVVHADPLWLMPHEVVQPVMIAQESGATVHPNSTLVCDV